MKTNKILFDKDVSIISNNSFFLVNKIFSEHIRLFVFFITLIYDIYKTSPASKNFPCTFTSSLIIALL